MAPRSYLAGIASRTRAGAPALAPPRRLPPAWGGVHDRATPDERSAGRSAPRGADITPPPKPETPRLAHTQAPVTAPPPVSLETRSWTPAPPPMVAPPPAISEKPLEPPSPAPSLLPVPPRTWGAALEQQEPSARMAGPTAAAMPAPTQEPAPQRAPRATRRQEAPADPLSVAGAALQAAMQWIGQPAPGDVPPPPAAPARAAPPAQTPALQRTQAASPVATHENTPIGRAEPIAARLPAEQRARPALPQPPRTPSSRSIHIGTIEVHVEPPGSAAAPPLPIRREERRAPPAATGAPPAPLSRGFTSTIGLRQG